MDFILVWGEAFRSRVASLVATTGDDYALVKIAIATLVIPPGTFAYAYFFAYKS